MIILHDTEAGYTFIEEGTGDYFCVIYNFDCNAPDSIFPLELGPLCKFEMGPEEIPF